MIDQPRTNPARRRWKRSTDPAQQPPLFIYIAAIDRGTGRLVNLSSTPFENDDLTRRSLIRLMREPDGAVKRMNSRGIRIQIIRSDLRIYRPDDEGEGKCVS